MSGFWANRLGGTAAPHSQPAPAPPANRPWWVTQPAQPSPAVQPPGAPAVHQQPVASNAPSPTGEVPIEVLLGNPNYQTTKPPKSERLADFCPECGSGNYMHIGGQENRAKRCFDCGHNPMFGHSTAGMTATSKDVPVHTARVQQGNTNNFNPQQIIGRVA